MSVDLLSLQGAVSCTAFFVAGILDSISGGGGLLTVPAMLAAGIPAHYVIGTNQFGCWIGTGVATAEYIKSGNVHYRSALVTIPFVMIGAFLGARWNLMIPERILQLFMIVLVPIVALLMVLKKEMGESEHVEELNSRTIWFRCAVIGLILGAYQGFYGAGSGVLFVFAYTTFLQLSLVRATGNSRFVLTGALTIAVLTYAFSGKIIWNLAIAAMLCHAAGAFLGARIAIQKGNTIIRPFLFVTIGILFVKLIADYFIR